ncbi:MAG TPA: HEAT repeat domain-containing protein, partial [Longimicrobium sp.]|nr:HEAT repeat domain-containing protein [Longimicrobium sp.]
MNSVRMAAAALLLAACAPAAGPSTSPAAAAGAVTEAGLLRLADRREYDEAYFRAALTDPDPAVARRAAWVLASLRRREGVALLAPVMAAHTDTSVLATAAFALGQIADSAGLAPLIPYADASRAATMPTVVAEAAYALGKIRHSQARAALTTLLATLEGDDPGTRTAAGAALLAIWRQERPIPVTAIDAWLRHADPGIRWRAAYALARRPEPATAAALYGVAADGEPLVRSFVARALTGPMADSSGVGRDAALDVLVRYATRDTSLAVRINALRSLGTHPSPRALALLTDVAAIGAPYESITAMESLGRLGSFAAPSAGVLRQEAQDADMPVAVRTTALAALAQVDRDRALEAARALVREPDWRLRAAAARAFAQVGDAALGDLATLLESEPDGRVAAAGLEELVTAAGDRWDPRRRALVLGGFRSPDVMVRTSALGGVARMADTALLGVVLDAYGDATAREDSANDAVLAAVDALA